MIDLNILKITGAFVAGLAGIIGILGQTRTQDNKLTRSGKWLFGMAIVGVVLALSTQIWEWRKSIENDRTARAKNQELLLKLDREAQLAAKSLHEVKRAVTRFQAEDISFDWGVTFDSTDKVFGPYINDVAKLAAAAMSKPWSFGSEQSDQGLRRGAWFDSGEISAFTILADSPAMPDEGKYALLRHFIFEAVPEIRVFKKPISPETFVSLVPDPLSSQRDSRQPDLILILKPGKVHIGLPIQKVEPKVPKIRIVHSRMDVSIFYSSGAIVSTEDLRGCQAILSLQQRDFREPWRTASGHWLRCRVNDQTITECSFNFDDLRRRKLSRLIATQLPAPWNQMIYSFTFPTSPAEGKQ